MLFSKINKGGTWKREYRKLLKIMIRDLQFMKLLISIQILLFQFIAFGLFNPILFYSMFAFHNLLFQSKLIHFMCRSFDNSRGCNHIGKMPLFFIKIFAFLCLEAFHEFIFENNFLDTINCSLSHTYFFE